MSILDNLRNFFRPKQAVIIVSGLPRSGTSMMMKMLEAGGLEPLIDNIRRADEDNPRGYYEFERVKKIKEDQRWLEEARGKVVKIISLLLLDIPAGYTYKVIFMRRKVDEILASQQQMLIRRGEPTDKVSDEKLTEIYSKHLKQVDSWMRDHYNLAFIYVNYHEALQNPIDTAKQVNNFLGNTLDLEAMVGVVDVNLYRQRK